MNTDAGGQTTEDGGPEAVGRRLEGGIQTPSAERNAKRRKDVAQPPSAGDGGRRGRDNSMRLSLCGYQRGVIGWALALVFGRRSRRLPQASSWELRTSSSRTTIQGAKALLGTCRVSPAASAVSSGRIPHWKEYGTTSIPSCVSVPYPACVPRVLA
jgi:hypothetical protein